MSYTGEVYRGGVEKDFCNLERKSQIAEIEKTEIKTLSGVKLFKYFNDNDGSSVWGKVLEGIIVIENEIENAKKK